MQIPEVSKDGHHFDIRLHNPETYEPAESLQPFWHELEFISNLPILRCSIGVEGGAHGIQLMIDSGRRAAQCLTFEAWGSFAELPQLSKVFP